VLQELAPETRGARKWIRDLASQFQAAGIKASFAFSMECYLPPAAMRAKYLSYTGGVVSPGADVDLGVPSHQMHFGTRVRTYLRQMYKECADQIEAAGLPVVLQFGETQWWYFDNQQQDPNGGMPYYDQQTIMQSSSNLFVPTVVAGDGLWHHFVLTRSGNTGTLYMDGASHGQQCRRSYERQCARPHDRPRP
jgi:hypothetical protein